MFAVAIIYASVAFFILLYGGSNYTDPKGYYEDDEQYRIRIKAGARALFLFWAWPLLIFLVAIPAIKRMWADAEFFTSET